jgi:hypothetical protein
MAPGLCLEGNVVDTTEEFGDRKIWQMRLSAINLSVTKSFGPLLPPLFPAMADLDRNLCKPPAEFRRNQGAHLMFSIGL